MARKKNKPKYDVFDTLRPMAFDSRYEETISELNDLATRGSKPIWGNLTPNNSYPSPELLKQFISLANSGMRKAQEKIVNIVINPEPWPDANSLLLNGIADSMAWQMIDNQLCYARRLYKEQPIIDLKNSNFASVIKAAEQNHKHYPDSFSLISDLTTFVQVGDLLTTDLEGKITIGEVKEGIKNHQILDFMKFFMKSGCPRALRYFVQEHGEQSLKQLQRMMRQANRMGHVAEVFNTGSSQDPDTEFKINIPEETLYIPDWDDELNSVLIQSDTRGWALEVIDDCLFIGSYSKTAMRGAGHSMFNTWFDSSEGTSECPRARLIDCMQHPLALPIFNRAIADRHKLDILFGRKNVCIGLNIPELFKKLRSIGITVREATNKQASELDKSGTPPYRFGGKAYFLGDGTSEMALMDGVLLRILFHSQRPIETIHTILNARTQNFSEQ